MSLASRAFILLSFCGFLSLPARTSAVDAAVVSPPVQGGVSLSEPARTKIWIFFADHGESNQEELRQMLTRVRINGRALERRARRGSGSLADRHDLTVNERYVDAVKNSGVEIRHESRYLNAVSAFATPEQIRMLAQLPYVSRVERVRRGTRELPVLDARIPDKQQMAPGLDGSIEYGLSGTQHEMINSKPLHAEGYTGRGVRIAVFDTGFFRAHTAFANLNVIAEWDFINLDDVTADQPYQDRDGQMGHGSMSLGILACNWPDTIMGVAWDAEYILAKTEQVRFELRSEEDDYIAALEWADGLGADIVSSSLGYFYWYDQEDMDGDTALITRAVDIAASRGILVVTAAGNENQTSWGTIIAPADADSAIAVGAVDLSGQIQAYSSHGPTADGRIKPDVMAQGRLVATVHWQGIRTVTPGSGTSAATPLVAGAAALILQKHPDWTPLQVREALRNTASRAATPDNEYGWGIIDAYSAANYSTSIAASLDVRPGSCDDVFNPKSRGVLPVLLLGGSNLDVRDVDIATLRLAGAAALRAKIIDMADGAHCSAQSPDGHEDLFVTFSSAEIAASLPGASKGGMVPLALSARLHDGTAIEGEATVRITGNQGGPTLSQNARTIEKTGFGEVAPNPFNPILRISYHLAHAVPVKIAVYDVRGELIATLVDDEGQPGTHTVTWNALSRSSGVYFLTLRAGGIEETRKVLLLK